MKRVLALVLVFLCLSSLSVSAAEPAAREEEVTLLVRNAVIAAQGDPRLVAESLAEQGIRFLGHQQYTVTYVYDGKEVKAVQTRSVKVGTDLTVHVEVPLSDPSVLAGEKTDLEVDMWLVEVQLSDGSFREHLFVSGWWSSREYSWIDDPADVIDVRWIVGDIVYVSSNVYDGIQRDQHTQGIASFTVDDQIASWDMSVTFRPVSPDRHGRYSNLFVNYTHTWWGAKLTVQLGAGPTGSTGSIAINTDARTWTKGSGFAFQIGSGQGHGPVTFGIQ